MTITFSELRQRVDATGSCFFSRETMRFFGDTAKNYRVVGPVTVLSSGRTVVNCWRLDRKRPVKCGLQDSVYFSVRTFERVFKFQPSLGDKAPVCRTLGFLGIHFVGYRALLDASFGEEPWDYFTILGETEFSAGD